MNIKDWQRLTHNDSAVYILPEAPDWILPNKQADQMIQEMRDTNTPLKKQLTHTNHRSRQVINEMCHPTRPYSGRAKQLNLSSLEECWFHITDQCNLACSHCMFSCSPKHRTAMSLADFISYFDQAHGLGARTFFLTGGEPLVHGNIKEICTQILDKSPDTQLVILTNGLLLQQFIPFFAELDQERIHFQVSMDGNETSHDAIRGKGNFKKLQTNLETLVKLNTHTSLAMVVNPDTIDAMANLVQTAEKLSISNVHYLWLFETGNARDTADVPIQEIFTRLMAAQEKASKLSISIDNIEAIRGRIFSPRGTRYDLGNAGWESLAIGPDGSVYPTPALIREPKALCGNAGDGLEQIWKTSQILTQIRTLSIAGDPAFKTDALKYLTGGSDLNHSFYASGKFSGHDPYQPLYNAIALWQMTTPASRIDTPHWPCIELRMGDRLLNCDTNHGEVALTHSNCVLSTSTVHAKVNGFYSQAAQDPNSDIINPVCYPEEEMAHVPVAARIRSYGCGSPVLDAGISPGDTLVDLGSGAGMECFIAANKTGPKGKVFGIDMTDPMLALAVQSLAGVEKALGYKNIAFKKAFLEHLPLDNDRADIVISNCVVNLSEDKPATFAEIFRVLKPGGRLVISDIVTDTIPPPAILNDPKLRGECIAGALTTPRLMSILEIQGFEQITIAKRFFYREVMGHKFFSITYEAVKPQATHTSPKKVLYPGPFAAVITDQGDTLVRGEQTSLAWNETKKDQVLILDDQGNVTNVDMENSCACYTPPEQKKGADQAGQPPNKLSSQHKSMTGCMQCGAPLIYFTSDKTMVCSHCKLEKPANAMCDNGHFICDTCHSQDAFGIVLDICRTSREIDMIKLLSLIRCHPAMPLHGPEHHFAIPGAIVAAYKNLGGQVTDRQIQSAIERGKGIPGGSCGFWGACGAALGVGIAFGIILESSPVAPGPRQKVQQTVGKIIQELGQREAARCCQRESWTALILASEISKEILPIPLVVDTDLSCTQMGQNRECPGRACQFFKQQKPILFQAL